MAAMATMYFHIAQTGILLRLFSHLGGPREQFGAHEKLSLESSSRSNQMPWYKGF